MVNEKSQLVGLVALQDLKEYLGAGEELRAVIAYDVMRPPPACVTPNQRLLDVLPVVLASEQRNIPVVNTLKENRLVGALARAGERPASAWPHLPRQAPACWCGCSTCFRCCCGSRCEAPWSSQAWLPQVVRSVEQPATVSGPLSTGTPS